MGLDCAPFMLERWFHWLPVTLITSLITGELPMLFPLRQEPPPPPTIDVLMCASPSLSTRSGKMNCHVPLHEGYCALTRGEIWTVSDSHRLAMKETSARVLVIVVSPHADGTRDISPMNAR